MNRYFLALAALVSAATAMAALPEAGNQAETSILNTVGSQQKPPMNGQDLVQSLSPLTSTQETALHRLMRSGCSAGHHPSFYGYPMDCKGQPIADTTQYVNLIYAEQLCKTFGGCS